jgi:hypothetical protein
MVTLKGPLLRGSTEWEYREDLRRSMGCSCMSYGSAPGERRDARACVAMPTPERMAVLLCNAEERKLGFADQDASN